MSPSRAASSASVVERIRRKLRKRSNPQPDAVEHLETLRQVEGSDRDEARGEPALRDERRAGIGREFFHAPRARDVFRQVEIVSAGCASGFGDA